ncbi:hypothetical protein Smp_117800 [Schistosoma mansoni]|uniref:hypothetical protein n=1 Tax=Schistosoma mansoni TaxID=6183 RepID=UPI00022DBF14|nr:hypothetical protein Smp_117800 [Schistosoma mansoni]|eukprot:XP_018651579.1 hypothetical protein Smp_117800 [Schistosoma mansoni]
MPDISEYRLGSACRINNSDQFSEKVDSEVSTADPFSSNTLKLGECTVPVQELQHVISEKPSSDDDGSSNNNPNMEEVTCCCHDGKSKLVTSTLEKSIYIPLVLDILAKYNIQTVFS